jgi:hypothetical protein
VNSTPVPLNPGTMNHDREDREAQTVPKPKAADEKPKRRSAEQRIADLEAEIQRVRECEGPRACALTSP